MKYTHVFIKGMYIHHKGILYALYIKMVEQHLGVWCPKYISHPPIWISVHVPVKVLHACLELNPSCMKLILRLAQFINMLV